MKKIIIVTLIAIGLTVFAGPKAAQIAYCLWANNGDGTISRTGLTVTDRGALIVGNGTLAYWGGLSGESLISSFDTANGDPSENRLFVRSKDGAGSGGEGYIDGYVSPWGNALYVRSNPSATGDAYAFMASNPGSAEVTLGTGILGPTLSLNSDGSIKAGGTEAWKLGSVVSDTVTIVTDRYVEVNIGGTVVKLAVVE